MALVSDGYFMSVQVTDASGVNKASLSYDVEGADLATALTNAQTIVSDLDAITDGVIVGYRLGEKYIEDTLENAPAGTQIENMASITVVLEDGAKHTLRIPAAAAAIFRDTVGEESNEVDLTNADLLAFLNNFTDETGYGVPGPDAIALVSDDEKIKPDNTNDRPTIKTGKRIHRASRKG